MKSRKEKRRKREINNDWERKKERKKERKNKWMNEINKRKTIEKEKRMN